MLVRDGMSRIVLTVNPGHSLRAAACAMAERRVGAAVVIDAEQPGPGHRDRARHAPVDRRGPGPRHRARGRRTSPPASPSPRPTGRSSARPRPWSRAASGTSWWSTAASSPACSRCATSCAAGSSAYATSEIPNDLQRAASRLRAPPALGRRVRARRCGASALARVRPVAVARGIRRSPHAGARVTGALRCDGGAGRRAPDAGSSVRLGVGALLELLAQVGRLVGARACSSVSSSLAAVGLAALLRLALGLRIRSSLVVGSSPVGHRRASALAGARRCRRASRAPSARPPRA